MRAAWHLLWLVLAGWSVCVPAAGLTVGMLLSGQGGSYAEALQTFSAELRRQPGVQLVSAAVSAPTAGNAGGVIAEELASAQLLVAVGTRAAQQLLGSGELRVPVLCLLVPRSAFDVLVGGLKPADARKVSAVHLDQPLARQVELIRQLLPGITRVSAVAGPESARELDRLRQALEARNLRLFSERVTRDSELFPALSRVMPESDAFLALPDPRILHAETAQNVLLTSYRLRTPVIGFSASYVRAGALAAVVSSATQAATQAGEMARTFLRTGVLPPAQYPKAFSVQINRQVARSLSLELDEESAIRDRMVRAEAD